MKWINNRVVRICAIMALWVIPLCTVNADPGYSEDGFGSNMNGAGCKLQGAWFTPMAPGFGGWMMTFNGTGDNTGTTDWEFPLEDDPMYPDGSWTIGRGIWAKTGPGTYDYTFQVYFLDDHGALVYRALNKGTLTLTDCDTGVLVGVAKFYDTDGNWVWCPDGCPYGPITVRKLLLNQEMPIQ